MPFCRSYTFYALDRRLPVEGTPKRSILEASRVAGTLPGATAAPDAGDGAELPRPMRTARDLVSLSSLDPNDQLQARRALYD